MIALLFIFGALVAFGLGFQAGCRRAPRTAASLPLPPASPLGFRLLSADELLRGQGVAQVIDIQPALAARRRRP